MADQPDQLLMQRIQHGDRGAYEFLIQRYQRSLFNFATRFLNDADGAADICQQTFIQFFLHVQELRTDEPLAPWLFRVARNRCLDELRRRHTTVFSQLGGEENADGANILESIADTDPLPDAYVERADLQQLLAAAIAALPTRYREVVALRYAADLSFAEIGQTLGLPEATVKTQFHRAKPLLRAYLRAHGMVEKK